MRRRRVVAGLVLLALFALVVALWTPGRRPCGATLEQAREGMSFAEVCATVGGPPGAYTDRPYIHLMHDWHSHWEQWVTDDATLAVRLDDDGRVECVYLYDPPPPDRRSFLARLRARLGL